MRLPLDRRQANLAGFAACCALLGGALYFQYALHLVPCNMCILQRLAVALLGVVFLAAGLQRPGTTGSRIYALLVALAALLAVALSARHVWMQAQPAGSLPSCGADFYTMVDMLPFTEVVSRIVLGGGECQAIGWSLLGLSIPAWLLVAVALLGIAGVGVNLALERSRRP